MAAPRAPIRLTDLRRHALARSLFEPTTLAVAIRRLGFVQADPIRAPARAQDLILRQRVRDYRVADLEQRYRTLQIEEDYFVNYGFLPAAQAALLHPRATFRTFGAAARRRSEALLASIHAGGELHPRDAAAHDRDARVANYWGGQSRATTQLLDQLHYRGILRVARRDGGVRVYAPSRRPPPDDGRSRQERAEALLRLIVQLYAPLPAASLGALVTLLRRSTPQLATELGVATRGAAARFGTARVTGTDWYWPAREDPREAPDGADGPRVRLLAPFDPVVWDRRRFERFWGWAYRFEAYTPAPRRRLGYYALPLLWRDQVIGWGNVAASGGALRVQLGYVSGQAPRERAYARELEAELARLTDFLQPARRG